MTIIDPYTLDKAVSYWETTAPVKDIIDPVAFKKYMLDAYGISIGTFMNQCHIVDEKKYIMFILKWS